MTIEEKRDYEVLNSVYDNILKIQESDSDKAAPIFELYDQVKPIYDRYKEASNYFTKYAKALKDYCMYLLSHDIGESEELYYTIWELLYAVGKVKGRFGDFKESPFI